MSSSPVSLSPSARVNTSSLPSSSSPSRRRVGIRVRSPTGPLDGLPTPSPFNHPHRHRQLPLELYNEIAQYHTKHRSTLLSLCLTSRDLSRIAQPYLFRNIDPKDVNKVEFLRVVAGEPEEEEAEEDKGDSGEEEEMRSEGEHEDSGMDGEERVSKSRVEKGKGKLKDEPIPNPQICQPSRATLRRREKESSEWLAGLVQRISVHRREDDRFDKQEKGVEGVEAEINYWRLLGLAMSKMKNLRAFAFTSYEPPKIIFQAKAALSHSELPKPASPATHDEGAGDATATHLEEILLENAHLTAGRSGSVIDNGGENTEPETVNIFKDCSFEKLQCIHWICSSDLGLFEFLQTSPLPALRVLHLGKCSYHLSLPSDVLPNLRECRATTCFLKNILKSHSNIDEVQWLLSCGPLGEESLAELRDPLKRIKTLSVSGRGVCAFLTRALSAMTRLECLKLRIQSNCISLLQSHIGLLPHLHRVVLNSRHRGSSLLRIENQYTIVKALFDANQSLQIIDMQTIGKTASTYVQAIKQAAATARAEAEARAETEGHAAAAAAAADEEAEEELIENAVLNEAAPEGDTAENNPIEETPAATAAAPTTLIPAPSPLDLLYPASVSESTQSSIPGISAQATYIPPPHEENVEELNMSTILDMSMLEDDASMDLGEPILNGLAGGGVTSPLRPRDVSHSFTLAHEAGPSGPTLSPLPTTSSATQTSTPSALPPIFATPPLLLNTEPIASSSSSSLPAASSSASSNPFPPQLDTSAYPPYNPYDWDESRPPVPGEYEYFDLANTTSLLAPLPGLSQLPNSSLVPLPFFSSSSSALAGAMGPVGPPGTSASTSTFANPPIPVSTSTPPAEGAETAEIGWLPAYPPPSIPPPFPAIHTWSSSAFAPMNAASIWAALGSAAATSTFSVPLPDASAADGAGSRAEDMTTPVAADGTARPALSGPLPTFIYLPPAALAHFLPRFARSVPDTAAASGSRVASPAPSSSGGVTTTAGVATQSSLSTPAGDAAANGADGGPPAAGAGPGAGPGAGYGAGAGAGAPTNTTAIMMPMPPMANGPPVMAPPTALTTMPATAVLPIGKPQESYTRWTRGCELPSSGRDLLSCGEKSKLR